MLTDKDFNDLGIVVLVAIAAAVILLDQFFPAAFDRIGKWLTITLRPIGIALLHIAKWFAIAIGCAVLFGILYAIGSAVAGTIGLVPVLLFILIWQVGNLTDQVQRRT